ncbi:CoA-binding protein [Halalkalicoccus salilacus]
MRAIWIQLGSWNDEATRAAEAIGLDVVRAHCITVEHG